MAEALDAIDEVATAASGSSPDRLKAAIRQLCALANASAEVARMVLDRVRTAEGDRVKEALLLSLQGVCDETVQSGLLAWVCGQEPPRLRMAALTALSSCAGVLNCSLAGSAFRLASLAGSETEDTPLRIMVLQALRVEAGDEKLAAVLSPLMGSPNPDVRHAAMGALGMGSTPTAMETLLHLAETSDDEGVVKDAMDAIWLGKCDARAASLFLKKVSQSGQDNLRDAAAEHLGALALHGTLAQLGLQPQAVAALGTSVRSDSSVPVRNEAAFALGCMRDMGAVEPLVHAIQADSAASVRESAIDALRRLADDLPEARQRIRDALEQCSKTDTDVNVQALARSALDGVKSK